MSLLVKGALKFLRGYRDLVKRGGAEYEAFTVNVGAVRWWKTLLRAKALAEERNGKVVPVADGGAIELVVGAEEWEKIDSVAKRCERSTGPGVELMTLLIVWSWSLSNPRTFCALPRPSTHSSWTWSAPLIRRAKV